VAERAAADRTWTFGHVIVDEAQELSEMAWRLLARLTVNYRTPAEIMAATAALLAAIDPGQPRPRSVRQTGVPPWRMATTRDAPPPGSSPDRHAAATISTWR